MGRISTEGGQEGGDVAGPGGVGEGAKVGRHILVVGDAAKGLGVLGHVVLVVPEAVAAAGNCHLRRGLLVIGPAEGEPFWRRLLTRATGYWGSGVWHWQGEKNLAAG